jgi:virginiamycin A acetyltransferase
VSVPDPRSPYPLPHAPRVGFLAPLVTRPNIVVGEYTYYDDPAGPERFQDENVLYHFDFIGDRLIIGRFCALAAGCAFIMNGANHRTDGPSTFPFPIFGGEWGDHAELLETPTRGDTVVGNDVWIGFRALVMPGVAIGHGAIVGAGSVVTRDVPPYAVVTGNPARVRRMRYPEEDIARLLALAWWDWPIEAITRAIPLLMAGDIDGLAALDPRG